MYTQKKIYVVMPVFNRREYVDKCLECFSRQTYKNVHVIVIDDGSVDGTSEMIRKKYPDTEILYGDGKFWWTGCARMGVSKALALANDGDYVLMINDDLIFDDDYLDQIMACADRYPDTLIGSVVSLIEDRGFIINGGVKLNTWMATSKHVNFHQRLDEFPKGHVEYIDYLTGRGVLIPINVFHEIGNYSPHFDQCGDMELPRRALNAGYKLIVCYDAVVYSYDQRGGRVRPEFYRLRDFWGVFFDPRSVVNLRYQFWNFWLPRKSFTQFLVSFTVKLFRMIYHFLSRVRGI